MGYVHAQDLTNTFFTEGEGYITFLDSLGLKLYGLNISANLSQAYRIQSFGNHFYISGLTQKAQEYGLLKIDSLGGILWSKKYGGTADDHCFGMDIEPDDGSIFSPAIP